MRWSLTTHTARLFLLCVFFRSLRTCLIKQTTIIKAPAHDDLRKSIFLQQHKKITKKQLCRPLNMRIKLR